MGEDEDDCLMSEYSSFLLIGLPTWAVIDGTWAVLAELADRLPEGYGISAYLMLSLTLGNVTSLAAGYVLTKATRAQLRHAIMFVLCFGCVTTLLLAFLWQYTVSAGGGRLSLPLFVIFFGMGACSSVSNVTHYMFVSTCLPSSTTALSLGMGLGSMVAGVLAILQGLLLASRGYSVGYYFGTLALLYLPALHATYRQSDSPASEAAYSAVDPEGLLVNHKLEEFQTSSFISEHRSILLLQMVSCSLGYGVVPALVSFACGRFDHPDTVLLLATGLAAIINPWARLLTDYYRLSTVPALWTAVALMLLLTGGLVLCATLPAELALFRGSGGALPIVLFVMLGNLFGYINTCVFRQVKDIAAAQQVDQAFRCLAVASQFGAFVGSVLAFIFVAASTL